MHDARTRDNRALLIQIQRDGQREVDAAGRAERCVETDEIIAGILDGDGGIAGSVGNGIADSGAVLVKNQRGAVRTRLRRGREKLRCALQGGFDDETR